MERSPDSTEYESGGVELDFSMIVSEHRIKKAYEDGEFNGLRGFGKPLNLDDDLGVPEELKMAHRMMKNAGFSTDEMNVKKEMMRIEDLIRVCDSDEEIAGTSTQPE